MKSFFKAKVKWKILQEARVQITKIKVQYYSVKARTHPYNFARDIRRRLTPRD